jgi:hypothetical protein
MTPGEPMDRSRWLTNVLEVVAQFASPEFQQSAWVEFNGPDGASFEERASSLRIFGWERHFLRRLIHIGLNQVNGRF